MMAMDSTQIHNSNLAKYLHFFKKLRRDQKLGGAPHKPLLLLSILNLIHKKQITNNRIEITPELVLTFKNIWSKLVITPHTPNFSLPFFHMRSEPFWNLVAKDGLDFPVAKSNSIKSLAALKETLAFAEVDSELFIMMNDPIQAAVLEECLLTEYFDETKGELHKNNYDLFSKLKSEILNEPSIEYQAKIVELKNSLSKEEFEEEVFVRGGVFKREIPKLYHFQCAVTGMRVESLSNAKMVDACHIVPFAVSKDDTIHNGFSLCPNMHRAFDRGIISISESYRVILSKSITESASTYGLKQFEGKEIILPENTKYFPDLENFRWHREEMFLG
jgi:putative restriction endonuclease